MQNRYNGVTTPFILLKELQIYNIHGKKMGLAIPFLLQGFFKLRRCFAGVFCQEIFFKAKCRKWIVRHWRNFFLLRRFLKEYLRQRKAFYQEKLNSAINLRQGRYDCLKSFWNDIVTSVMTIAKKKATTDAVTKFDLFNYNDYFFTSLEPLML